MKRRLRAGLTAAIMVAASFAVVTGSSVAGAVGYGPTAVPKGPALSTLPVRALGGLAVDDEHGHVFVGNYDNPGGVVVTDLDGGPVTTVTGLPYVRALFLDAATDSLYAVHSGPAISVIDTATLAVRSTHPLTGGVCPLSIVVADGVAWLANQCGGAGGLQSFEFATGELTGYPIAASVVRLVPGQPDLLVVASSGNDGPVSVVDVSTGSAEVAASAMVGRYIWDVGVSADGQQVLAGGQRLRLSDLTEDGEYPLPTHGERTIAVGSGSEAVGGFTFDEGEPPVNLLVLRAGAGAALRQFTLPGDVIAMAWSSGDRHLFALSQFASNQIQLSVIPDAGRMATALSLAVPRPLPLSHAGTVPGRLAFTEGTYDGALRTLTVTRADKDGVHALADVTTDSTGRFSFTDATAPAGRVVYTVEFAGDTDAAPATTTVGSVREVAWDVNGDGFAEVVTGAAGEDIGTANTTGQIHLLYGAAAGVSGVGSVSIHQDTPGVPGANENGDQFGFTQASGDFNGDGFADVAVSANAENVGAATNGGAVTIFYGGATGLRTDNVASLTIASAGYPSADNAYFGDALAAGDFNGDGLTDLAIGADGISRVFVAMGSTTGMSIAASGRFSGWGGFGFAVAAGDVNGDGRDDLAVGAPTQDLGNGAEQGAVTIMYGSTTGLSVTGLQQFSKETAGVPGSPGAYDMPDLFGWQVALADFSGDGRADLAVSAPGAPVTSGGSRREDAGTVTMLYSNGSRIATTGALQVTQDTGSMPGAPRKGDQLGLTLAAGDANGDGTADLAIFSGDGYVSVVPGAAGALAFTSAKGWTQDSPSVPGAAETGDQWGGSLRFIRPLGEGVPAGLLVGAPGENSGAGAITFLPAVAGTGLTGVGAKYFDQNSAGVPGAAEPGDVFGTFY